MAKKICSVIDCVSTTRLKRGWCEKHYKRWQIHGDPLFSIYDKERGFSYNSDGYKRVYVNGKLVYEHILIVEKDIGRKLFKHPTDPGLDEVVHHDNETKDDNRIENLILMTRSQHVSLHHAKRKLLKR